MSILHVINHPMVQHKLTNKTITKRHSIAYSGPSAVIVNGKGSTSGRFSLTNTWEKVQEIFDTCYIN